LEDKYSNMLAKWTPRFLLASSGEPSNISVLSIPVLAKNGGHPLEMGLRVRG
jgi:hypothetical protein